MTTQYVDRRQVQRAFSRAAPGYDQADFLVREIDRRMQERLDYVRIEPRRLLDLGCARGASLSGLKTRYPASEAVALDLSPAMLAPLAEKAGGWRSWLPFSGRKALAAPVAADAAQLPFPRDSFGLLWSNLLWHWLDDPVQAFAEAARVLEVGGLLMFSTLGPDTFAELRRAFGSAGAIARTQRFADMHDLGDMLVEAGFSDPVVDMEVVKLTYRDLDTLLAELRASGGTCAMQNRGHGLMGKAAWQAMRAGYEAQRHEGFLPVTLEVIYGHAWKAPAKQMEDGRSIIRFQPRQR